MKHRKAWLVVFVAACTAAGLWAWLPHAGAGGLSDKEALDWQLPDPRVKLPFAKETPIQFVTSATPAEWNKLPAFWNTMTETVVDPATGDKVTRQVVKIKVPLGLSQAPKVPLENPMTVQRWELGRRLYFDTILSSDNTVSCASCHDPQRGFTDQMPVSIGIGGHKGGVSAPTVMNSAYSPLQFWDGRAASLEHQAQGPVQNPLEMTTLKEEHAWPATVKRVRAKDDYTKKFLQAFGHAPTRDAIAKAIATYERTVLNGNSIHDRADRAMRQRVAEEEGTDFTIKPKDYEKVLKEAFARKDTTALKALLLGPKDEGKVKDVADKISLGRTLFFGKARCSLCHVGENFTDGLFHNLGVGVKDGKLSRDGLGRFAAQPLGAKDPSLVGAFKTPPLRGLVSTAPYMHDGSEDTLEKVIDFYDRGGNANEYLDIKMRDPIAEQAHLKAKQSGGKFKGPEAFWFNDRPVVPAKLNLTKDEKAALVLFLRALEGEVDALVMNPKALPK